MRTVCTRKIVECVHKHVHSRYVVNQKLKHFVGLTSALPTTNSLPISLHNVIYIQHILLGTLFTGTTANWLGN